MNARKISLVAPVKELLAAEKPDAFILNILQGVRKNGDKTGTQMAYIHYKPAQLKNTGEKFFIQYSYRHPVTGKWIRIKRYGIGENMGLNRITDIEERVRVGRELAEAFNIALANGYSPFDKSEQKEWTMFHALNLWKINTEKRADRKSTVQAYSTMVNLFLKNFKGIHRPLKEVTKKDVETFLMDLKIKNKNTATTYNTYLQFTKVFFNYCVASEMLDKSPAQHIKNIKAVISRHKYFTDDEFEKIKKHAPQKLFDFLQFIYETGIRPKEARLLKYKHVMEDRIFVPGSISKNRKDEYIPLSAGYAAKLKGEPEDYIFGGKVSRGENYYGQMFSKLKDLLNLDPSHTIYGMKHRKAFDLVKAGVDPYAIMKFFRHSSLEITMKYLRQLSVDINRDAVDKGRAF